MGLCKELFNVPKAVSDQLLPNASLLSCSHNVDKLGCILSPNEALNGLHDQTLPCALPTWLQTSSSSTRFANSTARSMLPRLAVKVVQATDVIHDTRLVCFDGRENKQILQVGIPAESTVLQYNLLKELNQLMWQAQGENRSVHLVHPANGCTLAMDCSAAHIPSLKLEEGVLVGDSHQLVVAKATFVCHHRQSRVSLLTILADHSIVHMHILASLAHKVFQELCQQPQAVAAKNAIMGKIRHKAKTIADVDERTSIWELGVHQEVLRPLWVIEIGLASDPFNLLDLPSLGCCFNVFEMNLRILLVLIHHQSRELKGFVRIQLALCQKGAEVLKKWRSRAWLNRNTLQNTQLHEYTPLELQIPLRARILLVGFMRAESAVMGRRRGCIGVAMSMMTTLLEGAVSRTQMNLSDSMVTCVKVMNWLLMPRLVNWQKHHSIRRWSAGQ
eukprot:SM000114S24146  [mRNA]  locus=s114:189803:197796:+ [translate_table: standard]